MWSIFSHDGWRRSSVGSLVSALIPWMRAPLLRPHHPPQAPPPNLITLGIRIPTREFFRDMNTQTVALLFSCSVMTDSATPCTAARQASLFFTVSQSLPRFMSIESVMPSNHPQPLLSPSPPALNLSQHQGIFQ